MKILIIYATAGAGHKRAAEAVFEGLRKDGRHDVQIIDSLDYTNPLFKRAYPWIYTFLITRLSWAWGFFFGMLDLPWMQPLVKGVRRLSHWINAQPLEEFVRGGKFDAIIVTQFLGAEVCSHLKRSGQIKSKVICVVTDFDVHRIWLNAGTDIYTGACDYTRRKLIALGVPAQAVVETGIPTDEKFGRVLDNDALRKTLGLRKGPLTVLIATGSFGMGPLEEIITRLKPYQLLVVCGFNRGLYERLKSREAADVHIFGLVDNMDELMSVADVMVTKPGGLSISEALVKQLPMIFFSAIPGQETHNVEVLATYGLSRGQQSVDGIVETLKEYDTNRRLLEDLRQKSKSLSKPNAVANIIALL